MKTVDENGIYHFKKHQYVGAEMAKEIIKLGMYIGLGGAVTFKNAVKPCEVAKYVPCDRLLIETDAPYMTPVPFRGKRNESAYIPHIAARLAELKGIDISEVAAQTTHNAKSLFKILRTNGLLLWIIL